MKKEITREDFLLVLKQTERSKDSVEEILRTNTNGNISIFEILNSEMTVGEKLWLILEFCNLSDEDKWRLYFKILDKLFPIYKEKRIYFNKDWDYYNFKGISVAKYKFVKGEISKEDFDNIVKKSPGLSEMDDAFEESIYESFVELDSRMCVWGLYNASCAVWGGQKKFTETMINFFEEN